MNKDDVRELLPEVCIKDFDDIVEGRSLGASNHIKMISNMYVEIAACNDEEKAKSKVKQVGNYFKETRGKSSYAIIAALEKMETKIKEENASFKENVINARNAYFKEADENLENLLTYTRRILSDMKCVMIYDYSSTVEKAICTADKKLIVYIPESRVINGGYPFVKGVVKAGHEVHFIPDASMLSVLKNVNGVFIGAETFYPDGTAFNTIGSDILAELCKLKHIPYYVLTPCIKCDVRARYGIYKEVLKKDLSNVLTDGWPKELSNEVHCETIELIDIQPELISGYVTEQGILKPSDLFPIIFKEELKC